MSLGRAFGSLAALTLLSRLSGFVRVAVFAAMYGGGREADLFLAAMILPELLYKFMADGLVSAAAIPIFVRRRDDAGTVRRTFWSLFWFVSACALALSAVLAIAARPICGVLVPGFLHETFERMVVLWRILTPYTFLSIQAALLTSYLNAMGQFARPAVGPLLVNLAIIAGMLAARGGPVESIGLAVLAGAFLQFAWLFLLAVRNGAEYASPDSSPINIDKNIIFDFIIGTGPVAAWVLLTAIVPLFERSLLSTSSEGAIAALNYTDKLINLPLGIVSISLASAVFPALSAAGEAERLRLAKNAFWLLGGLLVPVILVMTGGAEAVTTVVYRRGRFDAAAAAFTADLLRAYGWALFPVSVTMLLNRVCFAAGRFRLPFFVGLACTAAQVCLDYLLVARAGPVGVGWGAAGASLLQVCLLTAAMTVTAEAGRDVVRLLLPIGCWIVIGLIAAKPVVGICAELCAATSLGSAGTLLRLGLIWGTLQALAAMVTVLARRKERAVRE